MGHSLLLKKVNIFNMSFQLLSFWILKQWHFKTVLSSTYAQTHSQSDKKTRKHNQLCPLWPVAVMRKGCPWPPISLFHRRPNSTQPLTHLSHMANWAPVYSPQKRALKGEEKKIKKIKKREGLGQWGRDIWEPSSQKSFRSCDSSLWPLSSPHPLPQSCLYSTPPPPILPIPPSSPPLVPTAHHFHVSSAVGLIQTDCLTASKTYSHSQPPPFCPAFICGNRHSFLVEEEVLVSVWPGFAGYCCRVPFQKEQAHQPPEAL